METHSVTEKNKTRRIAVELPEWWATCEASPAFKMLLKKFPSTAAADDALQEARKRLMETMQNREVRNPPGFLFTTLENLFKKSKTASTREAEDLEAIDQKHQLDGRFSFTDPAHEIEAEQKLTRLSNTLSEKTQTILELYCQGFDYREIAQQTGITETGARKQVSRALAFCKAIDDVGTQQ